MEVFVFINKEKIDCNSMSENFCSPYCFGETFIQICNKWGEKVKSKITGNAIVNHNLKRVKRQNR